jgi:hypothetical protein
VVAVPVELEVVVEEGLEELVKKILFALKFFVSWM